MTELGVSTTTPVQSAQSVQPVRNHAGGLPNLELLLELVDNRTRKILEHRRGREAIRRRGWVVRRMLLVADVLGLIAAFVAGELLLGSHGSNEISPTAELMIFLVTLPVWIVGAKVFGLYDRDDERADYSSVDDLARVFLLATAGVFLLTRVSVLDIVPDPDQLKVSVIWALAVLFIVVARIAARSVVRRSTSYLQNTVIVGAGEVGQLVARKVLQHPEYGINLIGFVDAQPMERRADLGHIAVLGTLEHLPEIVRLLDVERVIFAFSKDSHDQVLQTIRALGSTAAQIDIVPRLFEVVGPRVALHTVQGLPLVGLPPVRLSPSSRLVKRAIDVIVSALALFLLAPLLLVAALLVKLDSRGPIFFRQTRLGRGTKEFTPLKFRTMRVGTSDAAHRAFIKVTMDAQAVPEAGGLYKLDREDAITGVGRFMRRTSLDELPQLWNVLKGDMSLVGPRPCLPYETEHFAPHHFERFLVPAGMTGLWQVTARARSTFGEALDMDVAYVRGWSLGLDLKLLCRTPGQMLPTAGTR